MRLPQKHLWLYHQEDHQRVPQRNLPGPGRAAVRETRVRVQLGEDLLPGQDREDHRPEPCPQLIHPGERVGEAHKVGLQVVLHLVHEGTLPALPNPGGQDGAKGGIHRVQEHRPHEPGQPVHGQVHDHRKQLLAPGRKLIMIYI